MKPCDSTTARADPSYLIVAPS